MGVRAGVEEEVVEGAEAVALEALVESPVLGPLCLVVLVLLDILDVPEPLEDDGEVAEL